MSTEGDNLVLEHLCHIRMAVDETRHDMREVKTRVGILEQQYASMSNRIDRIEYRLERIESRIGLIDA
jgi:predicted  nucleic acid-binding Zn-ribbon protein